MLPYCFQRTVNTKLYKLPDDNFIHITVKPSCQIHSWTFFEAMPFLLYIFTKLCAKNTKLVNIKCKVFYFEEMPTTSGQADRIWPTHVTHICRCMHYISWCVCIFLQCYWNETVFQNVSYQCLQLGVLSLRN